MRRAADDLAATRLIDSRAGQPVGYRVSYDAWAPLLCFRNGPPRSAHEHERFEFATAFAHWADVARARPLSDCAFGAHARKLLEWHRTAFERDRVALWSSNAPIDDWSAFVGQSVQSFATRMKDMA